MDTKYNLQDLIEITNAHHVQVDQNQSDLLIEKYAPLFDSLGNLGSTFFFIYDFVHAKYLNVSKSIENLLGINAEKLITGGCAKALEFCHPEDLGPLGKIHKEIFRFLNSVPIEERLSLRYDFNYRMKAPDGSYKCFLQQSQFIAFSEGQPVYDFGSVTDVSLRYQYFRPELVVLQKSTLSGFQPIYHFVADQEKIFGLSRTEKLILQLASKGLTSKEIAQKVSRSLHTINNHRKNIMQKTKSKSFYDAMVKTEFLNVPG